MDKCRDMAESGAKEVQIVGPTTEGGAKEVQKVEPRETEDGAKGDRKSSQ